MRGWFVATLLAALASLSHGDPFKRYDAADIRRMDKELRRWGIILKSLSKPETELVLPPAKVSAPAGDIVGSWNFTQFGRPFAAFEGIPYVKAPIGSLRFKLAQPLTEKLHNFHAKKRGSMCLQRNILFGSTVIEGAEDCLFINVYVPEKLKRLKSELLPVMFFVHGGGFLSGEGALYQPHFLLDKDIVLVTFNYRLGPLGFLTTEDGVIPSNLGLKDQVEALKWTRKNIAAFGGDPNLITIFGQSAGGTCIEHHVLSPLSRGLFHRALTSSGQSLAPFAYAAPGEADHAKKKAAEFFGCPTTPSSALLACLNKKTGEEITGVDLSFFQYSVFPIVPFKPVIEGDVPGAFLPFHPLKHYATGDFSDVPYMTGINSEDGGFAAIPIFNNETLLEEFDKNMKDILPIVLLFQNQTSPSTTAAIADSHRRAYFPKGPITINDVGDGINLFTDWYMLTPMMRSLLARSKHAKSDVYTWLFSYEGQRSFSSLYGDPFHNYGASHEDDLIYVFNFTSLFPDVKPTAEDVWMSIFMTDFYANFAKTGVPSSKLTKTVWKPTSGYDEELEYMHIAGPGKISMETNLLPERWTYVEEIKKIIKQDHAKKELE